VAVFDLVSRKLIANLEGKPEVMSAEFSSDGTRAVGIVLEPTTKLIVWDTRSGKTITTMESDRSLSRAVFSPDGRRILSSGFVGVKIWDAAAGKVLVRLNDRGPFTPALAFSPDGKLAAAGSLGMTKIWDALNGRSVLTIGDQRAFVDSIVFSPDSSKILCATADHLIRIWDIPSGKLVASLVGHNSRVTSIAFAPDGKRILSAQLHPPVVKVWAGIPTTQTLMGHQMAVDAVVFSPNGRLLASASEDTTVRLWDGPSGTTTHLFRGHSAGVLTAAFNPEGTLLASGSKDKTIRIWDVKSGVLIRTLTGHTGIVTSVAFNQDGTRLVSGSADKTIRVWDSRLGALVHQIQVGDPVNSVTVGKKDQILSSSGERTRERLASGAAVRIWDANSGRVLKEIDTPGRNAAILAKYSPDGARIIAVLTNGTAGIWKAATGKLIGSIQSWGLNSATFHPAGTRIFTASWNMIQLWDIASFQSILTLKSQTEANDELCLAFSNDGSIMASGSQDGTLHIWKTQPISQRSQYGKF
jgi:WD40 repeat protein